MATKRIWNSKLKVSAPRCTTKTHTKACTASAGGSEAPSCTCCKAPNKALIRNCRPACSGHMCVCVVSKCRTQKSHKSVFTACRGLADPQRFGLASLRQRRRLQRWSMTSSLGVVSARARTHVSDHTRRAGRGLCGWR